MQTNSTAPTRAHWWMAAMLCIVNAVAFIDRTALPLLIQPMKRHLSISDTQISLLIGAAFIATYTLGGLVVGVLVDRVSRRAILSAGIGFWGLATLFCGMASTFASLFLGRCGVGFGESACGPTSMSLIRDTFSPRYRGRAIAIWAMGASLGAGSALIAGGTILYLIGDTGSIALPILGTVQSWQVVLIACGGLSLPIALLVWTFPEPVRALRSSGRHDFTESGLTTLRKRWPVFLPLFLANAATIMLWTSYTTWLPALMGRIWHASGGQVGFTFGLIILVASTSSQFSAGLLVDLVRKRFGLAAVPALGAALCAAASIPAYLTPHASSSVAAWWFAGMLIFGVSGLFTIGTALVVHLSPAAQVGKISGLHFSWVGVMGSAVAPTLVALCADHLFGGVPQALGNALASSSTVFCALGVICLLGVSRGLHQQPTEKTELVHTG
ncbi:MFS transporter [Paraburkholderia phytofirmans]|uniref:MFS transporter n=1 Tax=Paraburkholderia phytofirmans TaxID=261302 RepID=UPI0038B9BAD4